MTKRNVLPELRQLEMSARLNGSEYVHLNVEQIRLIADEIDRLRREAAALVRREKGYRKVLSSLNARHRHAVRSRKSLGLERNQLQAEVKRLKKELSRISSGQRDGCVVR